MRNFIHYLRRDIRPFAPVAQSDPWFAEIQGPAAGFERPRYHVTRADHGAAAAIEPGDTIWLVGQLYSPWGKLPPALDGRIVVASINRLPESGFRYTAADSSRWFPLVDCTTVLKVLQTITQRSKGGSLWPEPHQPIGRFLQRPRQILDDGPLRQWEADILAKEFDYLSYRLKDGTRAAFAAARALLDSGKVVWWDRWSLPRRLAERREYIDDPVLQNYLLSQIKNANRVLGIASPRYDEPESYSWIEKIHASDLGKFEQYSME